MKRSENENKSEEQILRKKCRQHAKKVAIGYRPHWQPVKEFTEIDRITTSYSLNRTKANARKRIKQGVDLVLNNSKLKTLGQPQHDVLLTTYIFKHYKAYEDRIILKDGLLFGKTGGEVSSIKTTKFLGRRNFLMKDSETCTENLRSTAESLEQPSEIDNETSQPKYGPPYQ